MLISKLNAYPVNNHQNKLIKLKQNTNNYQSFKCELLPSMANNYMAKISFRGNNLDWDAIDAYTNEMGKRIYSKRNVTQLSSDYEKSSGITKGRGIPETWTSRIDDIDNFDRDSFIKEYGEVFEKEREFADVDSVQDSLTNLFKKHKIIDDKNVLTVKYIGHGFSGWAYKVCIDNDDDNAIVTKLFKRKNNYLQNHGNHTEQNLAEYIKEFAADSTEFVKYYYGDTKNGIMLVDYLKPNIEKYSGEKLDMSDIGIGYDDDFPKNRINGYICDFGGIVTTSNLIGNKLAQKVYSQIKYAKSDAEKLGVFNKVLKEKADTEEFKNKAIGLVYGIKYLPEDEQPALYKKCYDLNSHRVNVALIYNIKNMAKLDEMSSLIERLTSNVIDPKEQETIAKEIKNIPDKPRHRFFEEQTNTKTSSVIKYLARNINQYYKDLPNRRYIYETFIDNCDSYSGMALINSMHYMSPSRYNGYFDKFHAKQDPLIDTTLARNLELLGTDEKVQEKWIDILSESDNENVIVGLAESIPYVNPELRVSMFKKLLPIKDRVTKEFLAQNITSVPGHTMHPEWVRELLDGADNMVRGSLVNTIKGMKNEQVKEQWAQIVADGSDKYIQDMLKDI